MEEGFKVPVLPLAKPAKPEESQKIDEDDSNLQNPFIEKKVEIPYKVPKWSGPLCEDSYSFEVLKNGVIIDQIPNLNSQPFWMIGRMKLDIDNSLIAAHPSVSRFHAVIQYKKAEEDQDSENTIETGWYIYDLDSTHGSYINKMRVRPKTYVRLRVGHLLKFGNSTRSYILTGPPADEEEVSEFTITELKEQKLLKEAELQQKQLEEEEELRKKKEEEGASWGMGDDAEEENDLTENPFAMTNNEEFFVKDPKKTLRGFFEREGLNLEYKCDELSAGNFICKVELPIDDEMGNSIVCEVKHRGKKKECVEQCALECCRILDRHGMLRQANHEPRRSKKFEEDDSDDDGFYDRTGDVEKKALKKASQNQTEVLTYEQLIEQENEISQKINEKEKSLDDLIKAEKSQKQQNDDDLDSFMNNLNKLDKIDKFAISSVKTEIQKLKNELQKIQKLAQIAKPSINLDNIVKPSKSTLPLFGKRTALGRNFVMKKPEVPKEVSKAVTFEIEEDEDDEKKVENRVENPQVVLEPVEKKPKLSTEEKVSETKIEPTSSTSEAAPKKKKTRLRIKKEYRQNVDMNDDDEFIDEEKSATWIPPDDQQGDGMTHLNAKFGY